MYVVPCECVFFTQTVTPFFSSFPLMGRISERECFGPSWRSSSERLPSLPLVPKWRVGAFTSLLRELTWFPGTACHEGPDVGFASCLSSCPLFPRAGGAGMSRGNVGDCGDSIQRAVAFCRVVKILNHPILYLLSSWLFSDVGAVVAWEQRETSLSTFSPLQAGHRPGRMEIHRDKEVWKGWPEKSDQLCNFGTQTVKGKFYSWAGG